MWKEWKRGWWAGGEKRWVGLLRTWSTLLKMSIVGLVTTGLVVLVVIAVVAVLGHVWESLLMNLHSSLFDLLASVVLYHYQRAGDLLTCLHSVELLVAQELEIALVVGLVVLERFLHLFDTLDDELRLFCGSL